MKYLKPYSNWRSQYLLESILSFKDNIDSILMGYVMGIFDAEDPLFKDIAKIIYDAIGKDIPSNKYDLISRSDKDSTKLDVNMGKQINTQSIAKVIRSLLISLGVEITKDSKIKEDTIQKFADSLIGKFKIIDFKQSGKDREFAIKLVKGDEIPYWYKIENTIQSQGSELYKSCMNKDEKNSFMDFYAKNSDKVNLLIKTKTDIKGVEKLEARALVFKLDYSKEGYAYFMERCYANSYSDRDLLYKWLTDHYSGSKINLKKDRDSDIKDNMVVKITNPLCESYPWLDTLCYLFIKKEGDELVNDGFLSNNMDYLPEGNYDKFKIQNIFGQKVNLSEPTVFDE